MLTRLFWTDGLSRAEFDLFGDVLIFDSTYKTNAYRFPLVVLSGVNNHYNTCVFGAALLYNETVETYQWLLQNFRNAMGGKMPISVLTDQDAAMGAAIEIELPLAKHRICSWHLERNAMTNTHIPVFTREMGRLLKKRCSIEEFHTSWHSLIEKYGLDEHPWVVDIFKKRELWSEAYFRGHFFGMMRSTQRSESINSFLKLFLKQRMKLTELLKQYFLWIQKLRATYFQNQTDSEKSTPSLTSIALQPLESHAASIYTKALFEIVRKEIRKEQDLMVEEAINQNDRFFMFRFGSYAMKDGRHYSVKIDWSAQTFECECEMLESDGLPCRHLISAFKLLRLQELPEKCIKNRWTIAVGKQLGGIFPLEFPFEDDQRKRFAILNRECASLCLQSSQSESTTFEAIRHIRDLVEKAENDNVIGSTGKDILNVKERGFCIRDPKKKNSYYDVRDPTKVRSRGAPRAKKQSCGKCGEPGHKASTCSHNSAKI